MTIYKIIGSNLIKSGGVSIPADTNNRDYREYLDWVAAGNTPDPADPEPDVISIMTDSNIMIGDGVDEIMLSVHGKPDASVTINTLCGVTPGTINIQLDVNGDGAQPFSCDTSPTVIVFSCGEISTKVRAL